MPDRLTMGGPMQFSGEEEPARRLKLDDMPRLPRLWIGYVLGIITVIAEITAISRHLEITKLPLVVPPLYLFLPSFISLVYWLVCVYEYHVALAYVTGGEYPVRPIRAAWFHLIPLYQFYWAFKWSREFALFINKSRERAAMRPDRAGLYMVVAFVIFILFDRGFGMILLCLAGSKFSGALQCMLEEKLSARTGLPFS
jgi:hypothetical protein